MEGEGFKDIYNLKGGINAWQGLTAAGPTDTGMLVLKGDESPEEIVIIAYGMEHGLGGFYQTMAGAVDKREVRELFVKLSVIEGKHKERLFNIYLDLNQSVPDRETFESKIVSDVMEGGFTTEEFISKNREAMLTIPGLLDIAMMLETQALDLYMRYSQKIVDDKARSILFDIAEQEKAHLSSLGRLMDNENRTDPIAAE